MLERLVWTFGGAWLVGVTALFVTRALAGAPTTSAPALLSASLWFVGGAGFLVLGGVALGLDTRVRAAERARRRRGD